MQHDVAPLSPEESTRLESARPKGGRNRYQEGSLELVGRGRKKRWRGHYYVYVKNNGNEKRLHKTHSIGSAVDISKPEAKRILREFIATVPTEIVEDEARRQSDAAQNVGQDLKPSPDVTVQQFWDGIFLPMYELSWKEPSRKEIIGNVRRYVLKKLGPMRLGDVTKHTVQMHLNDLVKAGFSRSVVEKARSWSRSILFEAHEQLFIANNPVPYGKSRTRNLYISDDVKLTDKSVVDIEPIRKGIAIMQPRERLALRLSLVLALRPGEILALRRNDIQGMSLRIDENARYGKVYKPKTKASDAFVWMTPAIAEELRAYLELKGDEKPDAFIFSGRRKQVYRLDNYREKFFRPAMTNAGLDGITMQKLRRSCATFMNNGGYGNPKDIQAHLRHAQVETTMNIYVQHVPESVRRAVEGYDKALFGTKSLLTEQASRQ